MRSGLKSDRMSLSLKLSSRTARPAGRRVSGVFGLSPEVSREFSGNGNRSKWGGGMGDG